MSRRKADASTRTRNFHARRYHQHSVYMRRRLVGLEKTIERRIGQKSLGFHTDAQPSTAQRRNIELLAQVQPTDLIRYGLIPELWGVCPWWGCWAIWTRAR